MLDLWGKSSMLLINITMPDATLVWLSTYLAFWQNEKRTSLLGIAKALATLPRLSKKAVMMKQGNLRTF
jgi:hypothetical protein